MPPKKKSSVRKARPSTQPTAKPKFPDMTQFWAKMPKVAGDSTKFVEEDRARGEEQR
jgi:hypothetical protein